MGHCVSRADLHTGFVVWPNAEAASTLASNGARISPFGKRVLDHCGVSEAEQLFGPRGCGDVRTMLEAAEYNEGFIECKWGSERSGHLLDE